MKLVCVIAMFGVDMFEVGMFEVGVFEVGIFKVGAFEVGAFGTASRAPSELPAAATRRRLKIHVMRERSVVTL